MKPVVLVHGMYFGGWCWRKVAAPLREAGHLVHAPSLTGCGDRAHLSRPGITIETLGQDIANLLRFEDLREVTLVATSTGGMAVARAAELEPDPAEASPELAPSGRSETEYRLAVRWGPKLEKVPLSASAAQLAGSGQGALATAMFVAATLA